MGNDNPTPLQLTSTAQFMQLRYGQVVRIGGIIIKLLPKVSKAGRHTKPGRDIDLLILKDQAGEVEVLAFQDTYASCEPPLQVGVNNCYRRGVLRGQAEDLCRSSYHTVGTTQD